MSRTSGPFGPLPLTPLAFLERAASVYSDRLATTDGTTLLTYPQLYARCAKLAGGLRDLGIARGDRVSVLSPNTNMTLESHYAVPGAGAVLNMLNGRLHVAELDVIVHKAGSRLLIADPCHRDVAFEIQQRNPEVRVLIAGPDSEYEEVITRAEGRAVEVDDENSLLALNYTSGTTGSPKGVMYTHRGAYLQSLAMVIATELSARSVFLWTLPMFHCNGWCFPWAVTAVGGLHVQMRQIDADEIWKAVSRYGVTHLNAAPTVLTMMVESPRASQLQQPLRVATGGAPPSPSLLERLAELNVLVTHLYGLTETYGPAVVCEWKPEWDGESADKTARLVARQGIANIVSAPVRVVDKHGREVAKDGSTLGEVVLRGNNVMLGYFRDLDGTGTANLDGWFRTGDMGVMHEDGYLELRDRSKDVIISGGENIASIEVEHALASHPAVLECAVVGRSDEKWGQVPVAFVTLREGEAADERQLAEWSRARLAGFKVPKRFYFEALPKTATGKVRKHSLRDRAENLVAAVGDEA